MLHSVAEESSKGNSTLNFSQFLFLLLEDTIFVIGNISRFYPVLNKNIEVPRISLFLEKKKKNK